MWNFQKPLSLKLSSAILAVVLVGVISFAAGQQVKYDILGLTQGSGQLNYKELDELRRVINQKFDGQISDERLLEGAKAGMAMATGDPYTVYLNKEATKELNDSLNGVLSGIGAEVGIRSGKLMVIAPITGSPASHAGLRSKDEIIKINGEDTSGLSLEEAVGKIRGPKGTEVKLEILRNNQPSFEVTITRDVINVASVKWELKESAIGYIEVTRFGDDTVNKFREAARELKSMGATKFVVDLRNNPGGYLNGAVELAGEFINQDVIVEERRDGKTIEELKDSVGGNLIGSKTIILINGGSASASEIVAGALQDYGVATVVGEKSYGKGSVQELVKLSYGGNLKVTIAHWFTPKGRGINNDGIAPDVEVKMAQEDFDADRDPQLVRALELLK